MVAAAPQRSGDAILGDALFMHGTRQYCGNEIARAKSAFERALTLDPDHVNTLCSLATLERTSGDEQRSKEFLQRAIRLSPYHPTVRSVIGDMVATLGHTDNEMILYRQMLQVMPDSAKVHAAYAFALKKTGDLDGAMTHFKRAVEIDQGQPASFYDALGQTLIIRGNLEGAAISLRHAIALDPNLASAHCALGTAYLALERPSDAASSFRSALDIDPDCTDAAQALQRIEADFPHGDVTASTIVTTHQPRSIQE
jgi:Tfp pilus assembly protein PilF